MRPDSRLALVTGGGSGIGRAAALRLARGWSVAVVDIDRTSALSTASSITAAGGTAEAFHLDVRDAARCDDVVANLPSQLGQLGAVIHAAGVIAGDGPLGEVKPADWDHIIGVNLTGTANLLRPTLPLLAAASGGSIVLVASAAGLQGRRHLAAYSASKGGMIALTRSIVADYGASGVRVNCVCPGGTETPMSAGLSSRPPLNASGRLARPDEVAMAIEWLSEPGGWINGACIPVDDGEVSVHAAAFLGRSRD